MPESLRELLQPHWPAMVQRLGDRWPAFEATVRERALQRALHSRPAVARYAGLCLTLGPGFEERPENEWALAVLADERLGDWVKLHQVVLRAGDALRRRGTDPQPLLAADAALVDVLEQERAAADPDGLPLPREACDIDAIDLRLLQAEWRQEYQRIDGTWQRAPAPLPPSVRIDATHPAPPQLRVLTHAQGTGPAALLQLRQIPHGRCRSERHPAAQWLDARGAQRWQGHEARAVSWPVHAMTQPPAPDGLGSALIEETSPAVHLLEAGSCGLRDQGVPLGAVHMRVWAYPADQWLFALQRDGSFELDRAAAPAPATPTRVRLERDAQPLSPAAWQRGFDDVLSTALGQGIERLFAAWGETAQQPALQAQGRLLGGRGVLSWGWREGPGGLADKPLLRVLADLDLICATTLSLAGDIDVGASRTRVRLRAEGGGALRFELTREQPVPALLQALLPASVSWRCPFTIDFDPIANDNAVVCSSAGPCTGALVGEAGLRPRPAGSGWQWFLRLGLEPVVAPMTLHDPVLGQTRRSLALLPALTLVDWSLG